MLKNSKILVVILLLLFGWTISAAPVVLAQELKAEADYQPWSGWWWPKSHGELVLGYNGRPAPAEKYDLYVSGKRPGTAYKQGLQEWYDPLAVSWSGMCNGWVNASILETEPILPACSHGVFLTVGDKKGLLTACHFKDEIIYDYCSRNPAIFHRYLLKYIGEEGGVVGADLDSSEAFWSYPIFSYDMSIALGTDSDTVDCTIKYATDFVDPDYQGSQVSSKTYRYRLYKDAEGNYNGRGEWLGDAVAMHPQLVWIPVGIDQDKLFVDYKKVRELAQTVDDELEGGPLLPGHHLLMIYPGEDDSFTITPQPGEKLTCSFAIDPQSAKGNVGRYQLERNQEIVAEAELGRTLQQQVLSSETGSDEFKLTFLPGRDNSAGICVHLYVDVKAQYQTWLYGFPSGTYWLGCAAASANDGNVGERAWLEIVGDQGLPAGCGTVSGTSLDGGGHWVSSLENHLTEDYFSGDANPVSFKLISSTPIQGLLLAGNDYTLRGPPNATEVMGRKLVIPWLTRSFNMRQSATFYLANADEKRPVNVDISYFKSDGRALTTVPVELAPAMTAAYASSKYPGQSGGVDGWGLVESSDLEISGAAVLTEGYNRQDQLPLLKPGKQFIAPHLATSYGWQTKLGFCNPNPETLTVSLTALAGGVTAGSPYTLELDPYEKREVLVSGTSFGLSDEQMDQAWLRVQGDLEFASYLRYGYENQSGASIPLCPDEVDNELRKLPQLAVIGGWWTGVVFLNRKTDTVDIELVALDAKGNELQRVPFNLGPLERVTASVAALFDQAAINDLASLKLEGTGAEQVKALAIYGSNGVGLLSAYIW